MNQDISAALSKPIERSPAEEVRAAADLPPRVGRSILTVQGCSGCRRPSVAWVETPVGVRKVRNRLKMTRLPGVVFDLPRQTSGNVPRSRQGYAPLCKTCRVQAQRAA